jgi:hypothetical protein
MQLKWQSSMGKNGNHKYKYLAKSSYKLNIKYKYLINPLYLWLHIESQVYEFGHFYYICN